ncbi:MAG: HIT family protein, partial [Sulfuricella sp.]|nr:HIT family protein [Sulfuricella sp.]
MCELCENVGGTPLWQDALCRVVLVEDRDYPGFCRVIWTSHVKEMT